MLDRKRNLLAPGERMRVRHCEDHLFLPSQLAGQAVFGRMAADETNVGRAVEQCCDLQCRRLFITVVFTDGATFR